MPQRVITEKLLGNTTMSEITKSISQMKSNEPTDPDGINVDAYKAGGSFITGTVSCVLIIGPQLPVHGPVSVRGSISTGPHKKYLIISVLFSI